jgi:hypothetical protein
MDSVRWFGLVVTLMYVVGLPLAAIIAGVAAARAGAAMPVRQGRKR